MNFFVEDKDMINFVLSQLKGMGVKVPKMKKNKINSSKQDKSPLQSNNKVFGVCLADQEGASYSNPPRFILSCTEYLQKYSKEIGIFRKAGSISRQKNLRVKIENGDNFEGSEPNDAASLLKQWLRELPEPLIPSYLHDSFIRCNNLSNDESRNTATLLICLLLPPNHLHTLKHLMTFLAGIASDKDKNQMDVHNLALIMTPNIFVFGSNVIDKSSNRKVQQFTSIIELLIKNANKIGDIPSSLSLKLPILEGKCESESPSEVLESCPSISTKQYLLRSIKKLVKQNTTSATTPMKVTPDRSSTLLRHTLSVTNIERVCLKATAEAKENSNLFAPRNPDDVCKRSFRLLRRKDKSGLKPSKEYHPFTQSLEIESPLNFQMKANKMKMLPSVQEPLSMDKLDIGNYSTIHHFGDKRSELEDIEMITFSTHLNKQSNNLVAFPIPSFSQNLQPKYFLSELKKEYDDKTDTKDFQCLTLDSTNNKRKTNQCCTNISQEVEVVKSTDIFKDTWTYDYGHSINNRDLDQPKKLELLHNYRKVAAKQSAIDDQNISPNKISTFRGMEKSNSSQIGLDNMAINKVNRSLMTCSIADNKSLQIRNTEVLNKNCSGDSDVFRVSRDGTFVIEPSQNSMKLGKIKRPYIDEQKCKKTVKNVDNKQEGHDNISQKRQCTSLNAHNKTCTKNPPVKRVSKKSIGSGKNRVVKNKSSTTRSALQKTKNATYIKGCTSSDKMIEDLKVSNLQLELPTSQSILKREIYKIQSVSPSCHLKDKFSDTTASLPQNFLETSLASKRKLSFSRYPVTASIHSDSKIPRLRNSLEASASNSFTEVATSRVQKVSKSKPNKMPASQETTTGIPIKCGDSQYNLSTLDVSINDSCFLTPRRNAILSPNSVVWMSGKKYFDSNSPKEEAFNKRESIAMILKSNSGHVQAKVHLYDDLLSESTDSKTSVPSHSTPTSKFNRRLSNSQSMRSTPKQKTNAQNSKLTSSKTSLANRSSSLKTEKSVKSLYPPKFITHMNTPSPIKCHSLKDVTNTSVVLNGSKNSHSNFQIRDDSGSIFVDENIRKPIKRKRIPKGNSFSGNTSRKFVKKISRSESSPGCPRPYLRVECLIQESNYEE